MGKSKKECCPGLHKWFGLVVLLFGIWYVLADLGYAAIPINWWSALFLLVGAKMVYKHWFA